MSAKRKIVLGGLLILGCLALAGAARADAFGCDVLGVLGFPDMCTRACRYGWHNAWANEGCILDFLVSFT